jgi:beta-phosphoglucomutase-like phosphatase (HAD superfamily)
MAELKRKIAIIKDRVISDYYRDDDNYSGYDKRIVESITKWEEVSEETFEELSNASYKLGFTVIEQPIDPENFVIKSISDYRKLVAKEKAREEEEKREREKKALLRKQKKEAKTLQQKKELLEKLQSELGIK